MAQLVAVFATIIHQNVWLIEDQYVIIYGTDQMYFLAIVAKRFERMFKLTLV